MSKSLEDRVHQAFSAINRGIQAWFNGSVPDNDESFGAITELAHPEFSYVFPDGAVAECGAFWTELRDVWGANPDLEISTPREHTRLLLEDEELVVAEIVELQIGARAVARPRHARRSTLLFKKAPQARFGLLLWRLHESLMNESEEAAARATGRPV